MATNPPSGDGHRNGAVKGRSQAQTPSGHGVKRDADTGRFMDVKTSDKTPFKGVRKEKKVFTFLMYRVVTFWTIGLMALQPRINLF